jgi:hypothetical protein
MVEKRNESKQVWRDLTEMIGLGGNEKHGSEKMGRLANGWLF